MLRPFGQAAVFARKILPRSAKLIAFTGFDECTTTAKSVANASDAAQTSETKRISKRFRILFYPAFDSETWQSL